MEGLLQYIWQHKLWLSEDMVTNDGRRVRVIDPGLLNTDAGPDFFNAKVEIDGHLWVGNVEIHVRATDWKRHHHNEDPAYDNVILHVVEKDDAPVTRINGEVIPQVEFLALDAQDFLFIEFVFLTDGLKDGLVVDLQSEDFSHAAGDVPAATPAFAVDGDDGFAHD